MRGVGRQLVKEALAELADAPFENRVWLAEEGPEIGSIVVTMGQLFDDSGLGDALNEGGEFVFTAENDAELVLLPSTGCLASTFARDNPDSEDLGVSLGGGGAVDAVYYDEYSEIVVFRKRDAPTGYGNAYSLASIC